MSRNPLRISGYMTVAAAAEFLGVSPITLRRWDNSGKLKARRNPMNRYRLYRKQDLETVLVKLEKTKRRRSS